MKTITRQQLIDRLRPVIEGRGFLMWMVAMFALMIAGAFLGLILGLLLALWIDPAGMRSEHESPWMWLGLLFFPGFVGGYYVFVFVRDRFPLKDDFFCPGCGKIACLELTSSGDLIRKGRCPRCKHAIVDPDDIEPTKPHADARLRSEWSERLAHHGSQDKRTGWMLGAVLILIHILMFVGFGARELLEAEWPLNLSMLLIVIVFAAGMYRVWRVTRLHRVLDLNCPTCNTPLNRGLLATSRCGKCNELLVIDDPTVSEQAVTTDHPQRAMIGKDMLEKRLSMYRYRSRWIVALAVVTIAGPLAGLSLFLWVSGHDTDVDPMPAIYASMAVCVAYVLLGAIYFAVTTPLRRSVNLDCPSCGTVIEGKELVIIHHTGRCTHCGVVIAEPQPATG